MEIRNRWGLILLPLIGCACLYGYLLYPAKTFCGMDFLNLDYPRAELIHRAFLSGRIPLWNPFEWGGAPLLAAMQGSVLYPLMWPFLLVAQPYGLQLSIFFHVMIAALGGTFAARSFFQCNAAVAAFAGFAYAGGGYFIGRIEQANIVATFAWTPWLFWAAYRFLQAPDKWGLLLLAVVFMILPGHPQTTAYALAACGVFVVSCYLLERAWLRKNGPRTACIRWRTAISGVVVVTVAFAICAGQLLPTQELSSLSERVWPYSDPLSPQLGWRHLPALFVPGYYHALAGPNDGKPFGYTELGLYCGVLAVPLFVFGSIISLRRREPIPCALLSTWLFAMWFALGNNGGLSPLLLKLLPFLEHIRGVARMLNSATLCHCLLACYGLHYVSKSAFLLRWRYGRLVPAAAFALLVFDLCITNWRELLQPRVETVAVTRRATLASRIDAMPGRRVHRFMQHDSDFYLSNRPTIAAYRTERIQPNLTSVQRVRALDGYEEALLPSRTWANLLRRYNRNLRSDRIDAPLLSLLGAGFLLTEYPISDFGPNWKRIAETRYLDNQLSLWTNSYRPPLIMEEQQTTGGRLSDLLASTFAEDRSAEFIMRERHLFAPPGRTAVDHPFFGFTGAQIQELGCVTFEGDEFNLRRFRMTRPVANDLLILQPYFPGWQAQFGDGEKESSINIEPHSPFSSRLKLSRPVANGTHLALHYRPYSFRLGMFVTLVSLLGLAYVLPRKHGLTR